MPLLKRLITFIFLFLFNLFFFTKVLAATFSSNLDQIKAAYKQKQYEQLVKEGEHLLKDHPNDVDVQLYVGLAHYQLKHYQKAEEQFKSVLKSYPNYKEAKIGLEHAQKAQKIHAETRKTKIKSKQFFYSKHQFKKQFTRNNPQQHKEKVSLRDKPHYELTGFSSNASVSNAFDPNSVWDWSTASLYRKNDYGSFGGGINYANRRGMAAPQGFINAQPRLSKNLWLDLTYAYANNPSLYPNNTLIGEAYLMAGKSIELSAGEGYRSIQNTYFNTITGSVGVYIKNYYASFRPNYFVPKQGPRSLLYAFKARRYSLDNPDQWIGFVFSTGTSPDLFDLQTVNFIRVYNTIFLIEGQQPLNDAFAFLYGLGYEAQKYPSGFVRTLAYGNIGLKVRFE